MEPDGECLPREALRGVSGRERKGERRGRRMEMLKVDSVAGLPERQRRQRKTIIDSVGCLTAGGP